MYKLSDKLEHEDLQKYIFAHDDIVICVETMKDSSFSVSIPTHKFIHFARPNQDKKAHKVVSVFSWKRN